LAVHENAWSTGEAQAKDLQRILERFGVPASGRILDAPCGIGRHGTRLAKMGYDVVGVDLSPTFVERANDLADREAVADRATYRMQDWSRFFRRNGEDLDHIFTTAIEHWIYSLHDLQRLMVRGGWSVVEAFGGFKMDPPSIDSPTQLVVGRR